NDRQPHGGFGRRNHHDKEHEDVAAEGNDVRAACQPGRMRVPVVREGHKTQVHGVQHQLNRHKDGDDVALEQKAEHAQREENRAQDEVPRQGNQQISFFPSTTAPIMPIRISTEVASNGSRKFSKSSHATLWVSPKLLELMVTPPRRPLLRTSIQPTIAASATTPGTPTKSAMRLPRVRSSAPAFSSMMTK